MNEVETPERDVLRLSGVTKQFGSVTALDNISFNVRKGEIHGLIGQNGAGKSTLMAVASGALVADTGTILIGGEVAFGSPQLSRQLGLAIVRQEPALMPDLTVAENLYLGIPDAIKPSLAQVHPWATALLARWKSDPGFHSADRVNTLSAEQRFVVEIVKALANEPKVLVLDEPTEHLVGEDVQRLFDRIREIAAAGAGIVYISHRIREVRAIANRVTVLRDGVGQGTFEVRGLSEHQIIELIVGKPLAQEFPSKAAASPPGTPCEQAVLRVDALSGPGFRNVSMHVLPGEIVGLAGIDGNGQREFMRAMAGLVRSTGAIQVAGQSASIATPHDAARLRIQYVPGDRHREGVFEDLPIRSNFSLRSLLRDSIGGLVVPSREAARAREHTTSLSVKLSSIEDPIRFLSGGNQQKVVIGSALAADPKLLLVDEPTQGVDIGSRAEIYKILRDTAQRGAGIMVVSSDSAELAGLCDRVLCFSRGTIASELTGAALSENDIVASLLTTTNARNIPLSKGERQMSSFWALLSTDWAPVVMVAIAVTVLGIYAAFINDSYLSSRNMSGMLALVATLALAACGQQVLVLVGGIDLSVGPLMGLIVVVQSFYLSGDPTPMNYAMAIVWLIAVALAVGLTNWLLVDPIGLHPMVATLATFMALQAISLMLRPTADGLINDAVMDAVNLQWGFVPVTVVCVVAFVLLMEYGLFRKKLGVVVRGFGSKPDAARVAGINPRRTRLLAYLGCSVICSLGAIPLLGQVGIGDPKAGIDYTLTSIAAVVIGGGSLFGARGSFIGALCGALLITQVNVVTTFLSLSESWQSYLLGIMILLAVALHSKSRQLVLAR